MGCRTKVMCVAVCVALFCLGSVASADAKKKHPHLSYFQAYAVALDVAHREELSRGLIYVGYQVESCQRIARNKFQCTFDYWGVKPGSTYPDPPYSYLHFDCQDPVLVVARLGFYPSWSILPGARCVTYQNDSTASANFP